jgi:hypothetical protein
MSMLVVYDAFEGRAYANWTFDSYVGHNDLVNCYVRTNKGKVECLDLGEFNALIAKYFGVGY